MPHRRRGTSGSFGAPLDQIVTSFPADVGRAAFVACKQGGRPEPRLTREDVGASIRAAFMLIDRIEER
jgi:hypothetical protein